MHIPHAERPQFPFDARWDVHVPRALPDRLLKRLDKGKGRAWYDKSGRSEIREWIVEEEARRAGRMRKSGLCLVSDVVLLDGHAGR